MQAPAGIRVSHSSGACGGLMTFTTARENDETALHNACVTNLLVEEDSMQYTLSRIGVGPTDDPVAPMYSNFTDQVGSIVVTASVCDYLSSETYPASGDIVMQIQHRLV
eukprot:Blabericola_migrator_1__1727@NODE_1464_length_4502_cov_13_265614_g964_i0_p6_GENE_NODE_1464_length_4502_cov_13_265614_g964_i0NODE_1464_length_4502_cov_13_265614_g964_i0_p6_ORF_typecomplete_len109_score5_29ABC_ATPase/PF09818_9/0_15_NODE_1464_length_4502_cov_13_265614_g964_i0619945